ncbi:hypothetical protein [Heyndrickxia oleronia]|nr:hypothetical protein [Heyndrickxia oleronia]
MTNNADIVEAGRYLLTVFFGMKKIVNHDKRNPNRTRETIILNLLSFPV